MKDLSWTAPPLRLQYEKWKGPADESGNLSVMDIWNAVQAELTTEDSAFIRQLSTSQHSSVEILAEWWNCDFEDDAVVHKFAEATKGILPDSQVGDITIDRLIEVMAPLGPYYLTLVSLFVLEFRPIEVPTSNPWSTIEYTRRDAGIIASCQRLGWWTYCKEAGLELSTRARPRMSCPALLDPCPWIPPEHRAKEPHYLWDIQQRRTVCAKDLDSIPEYTVISHTWGRWRRSGQDEWVDVPGVPWRVPTNTRFVVADLPREFARSRRAGSFHTRFLWFDLFCIPQEESVPWQRVLARQEIANQAGIFGGAAQALVWLNHIPNWTGLRLAVRWFALLYLHKACGSRLAIDVAERMKMLEQHTHADITSVVGLCFDFPLPWETPRLGLRGDYAHLCYPGGPCGWFTSLWTLQEFCLRTDMVLVDRSFNRFQLDPSDPLSTVTLDSIFSIFKAAPGFELGENLEPFDFLNVETMPWHAKEVLTSRMLNLLNASPTGILLAGEGRTCTSMRAEAISAVVGATRWMQRPASETDLVFGLYPIEFLREVREREGADFFVSIYNRCCFWDVYEGAGEEVRVAGTILPIDTRHPYEGGEPRKWALDGSFTFSRGHASVDTWRLADDGRVLVSQVGIVASTDAALDAGTDEGLRVSLRPIPRPRTRGQRRPSELSERTVVNLHECLAELNWIPGEKHAIIILHTERPGFGVLLGEVRKIGDVTQFGKLLDFQIIGSEGIRHDVDGGVLDELLGDSIRVHDVDWEIL